MHRRATFRRLRRIDLTPSPFGRIATYLTHQPQLANSIARHKSRRDSVLQPRVGVFPANPGKRYGKRFNPNGVASTTWASANIQTDTTLSGLQLISLLPRVG